MQWTMSNMTLLQNTKNETWPRTDCDIRTALCYTTKTMSVPNSVRWLVTLFVIHFGIAGPCEYQTSFLLSAIIILFHNISSLCDMICN